MNSTVIVACKTLESELCAAMERANRHFPIRWLEAGLHNVPEQLNARLQAILDSCQEFETILLAMGFCGGALTGLQTHSYQVVVPRCDDCITLLLGSAERRRQITATYYLTEGWLNGERNIWREYEYCVEKYGKNRGDRIFSVMLSQYRYLALLNPGIPGKENAEAAIRRIARELKLEFVRIDGTLEYIKDLLNGNWAEERFLVVPPNSTVTSDNFLAKGEFHEL